MAQWEGDVIVGGAPGQTSGSGMEGSSGQGGTQWEGDEIVSTPQNHTYQDSQGNIHLVQDFTGQGGGKYDIVVGGFQGGYGGSGFREAAATELSSPSVQRAAESNALLAQAGAQAVEAGIVSGHIVSLPNQQDQYFLTPGLAQRHIDAFSTPSEAQPQPMPTPTADLYNQAGWGVLTQQAYAERYGLPFAKQPETAFDKPYFIDHPKYGKMTNIERMRFEEQENAYKQALGNVIRQEAIYDLPGKELFGIKASQVYSATEELIIPQLLGAKVNQIYLDFFGTEGQKIIAERQLIIERGQYYGGLPPSDKPLSMLESGEWLSETIPVQAYAMGGAFKLGTLGIRWGLKGLSGAFPSGSTAAKALLFGEKTVEPIAITGGLGYMGYDIYKTHELLGADAARGQAAVMLVSLPFAVAGWKDVGKAHSRFLTIGKTEVSAPVSEDVLLGKTTFPEIPSVNLRTAYFEKLKVDAEIRDINQLIEANRPDLIERRYPTSEPRAVTQKTVIEGKDLLFPEKTERLDLIPEEWYGKSVEWSPLYSRIYQGGARTKIIRPDEIIFPEKVRTTQEEITSMKYSRPETYEQLRPIIDPILKQLNINPEAVAQRVSILEPEIFEYKYGKGKYGVTTEYDTIILKGGSTLYPTQVAHEIGHLILKGGKGLEYTLPTLGRAEARAYSFEYVFNKLYNEYYGSDYLSTKRVKISLQEGIKSPQHYLGSLQKPILNIKSQFKLIPDSERTDLSIPESLIERHANLYPYGRSSKLYDRLVTPSEELIEIPKIRIPKESESLSQKDTSKILLPTKEELKTVFQTKEKPIDWRKQKEIREKELDKQAEDMGFTTTKQGQILIQELKPEIKPKSLYQYPTLLLPINIAKINRQSQKDKSIFRNMVKPIFAPILSPRQKAMQKQIDTASISISKTDVGQIFGEAQIGIEIPIQVSKQSQKIIPIQISKQISKQVQGQQTMQQSRMGTKLVQLLGFPTLKKQKTKKGKKDTDFFFGFRESPIMPAFGKKKKPEAGLFAGTLKERLEMIDKVNKIL